MIEFDEDEKTLIRNLPLYARAAKRANKLAPELEIRLRAVLRIAIGRTQPLWKPTDPDTEDRDSPRLLPALGDERKYPDSDSEGEESASASMSEVSISSFFIDLPWREVTGKNVFSLKAIAVEDLSGIRLEVDFKALSMHYGRERWAEVRKLVQPQNRIGLTNPPWFPLENPGAAPRVNSSWGYQRTFGINWEAILGPPPVDQQFIKKVCPGLLEALRDIRALVYTIAKSGAKT